MANAPFCNVNGVTVPPNPSALALVPVPKATDLASALAAIRALTTNFNTIHSQVQTPKQVIDPAYNPDFIAKKSSDDQNKTSNWIEDPTKRVKAKVKVENPDDPSQFVEVEQINSYTMKNKKTGELFTWKR